MILIKIRFIKNSFFLLVIFSCLIFSCKDSKNNVSSENIQKGAQLFASVGCATCHSLSDDHKLYGPSLHNILGTQIKVIRNGEEHSILVDKDYIKLAIVDPDYEKPVVYKSNKMPKPSLTHNEVNCIVDYLIVLNKK